MSLDRLSRRALRIAAIAAVAFGVWFSARGIAPKELLHALGAADLLYVAVGTLPLLVLGSLLRTARYGALLPTSSGEHGFWDLWSAVVLSGAANNVLPLRAGELVRTRETMARGLPLAQVAFAQVTEKLVEAATLVVCSVPVLLAYATPGHPVRLVSIVTAVLVVGVTVALRLDRRDLLRAVARSSCWSFAADAVELAIIAVCLRSLGLPCGLVTSIAVYAAVNLAIALPSTPGNVGAFEAGAALPLIALGVSRDAAVAFACVYRVVQWLPLSAVGLAVWARQSRLVAVGEPS